MDNTVLAKGDVAHEVTKLKKEDGSDIIVFGGFSFVASLVAHGLIDEYHLFINRTAIGKGQSIFRDLGKKLDLKLKAAVPFDCGISLLRYGPL
ncbi:dihydrofolate reductase family protein [Breznakiella homolactica]|uniref:Dihydrofolate reductase family protein n=1 Tax=Breznakiella homolactica TaxID=2798577 RepID=A0A7T8B8S6_9SPIR|nr:dihydrofolate reductase family protein [Breznakiella homolactica]QQO07626.1 dihydrofolate reductase family protein [Breznakiella homolactica]